MAGGQALDPSLMPSPHSITGPTLPARQPSGSYPWTKCASASPVLPAVLSLQPMALYSFRAWSFPASLLPRLIRFACRSARQLSRTGPACEPRSAMSSAPIWTNTAYDRGIYHDFIATVPVGGAALGEPPLAGPAVSSTAERPRDQLLSRAVPRAVAHARAMAKRGRAGASTICVIRPCQPGSLGRAERTDRWSLELGGHRRAGPGRAAAPAWAATTRPNLTAILLRSSRPSSSRRQAPRRLDRELLDRVSPPMSPEVSQRARPRHDQRLVRPVTFRVSSAEATAASRPGTLPGSGDRASRSPARVRAADCREHLVAAPGATVSAGDVRRFHRSGEVGERLSPLPAQSSPPSRSARFRP